MPGVHSELLVNCLLGTRNGYPPWDKKNGNPGMYLPLGVPLTTGKKKKTGDCPCLPGNKNKTGNGPYLPVNKNERGKCL